MAEVADDGGGGGPGTVLFCDYAGVQALGRQVIAGGTPLDAASSTLISSCMDAVTAAGQFGPQLGPGAEAFSNDFGKGLPGLQENFEGLAAFLNVMVQSLGWVDTSLAQAAPTTTPTTPASAISRSPTPFR